MQCVESPQSLSAERCTAPVELLGPILTGSKATGKRYTSVQYMRQPKLEQSGGTVNRTEQSIKTQRC